MKLAAVLVCVLAGVAHADRQQLAETRDCVDLAAAHTVEVAGDVLYAIHDGGLGYGELFVIKLQAEPTLLAKALFTQMYPKALHIEGHRVLVSGSLAGQAPRVVALDVTDPTAPALLPGETPAGAPACREPKPVDPPPALRDGDLAIVPVSSRANAFLAVLRPGQPPAALDHAALVTENHREFIRSLPQGECLQYQWPCTEAYLQSQLRTAAFELVTVRGERLYSLSTAGLAVHRLDTLALVGSLRWPTMQARVATWF
jgi:hypothetical protein